MKMKHFILSLLFVSTCYSAMGREVTLEKKTGNVLQSGHCYEIPTVSQDGDEITFKSDTTLTDVLVVIKDEYGNVMHNSMIDISPIESTIIVPDNEDCQKTTIDIYYRKEHLFGCF